MMSVSRRRTVPFAEARIATVMVVILCGAWLSSCGKDPAADPAEEKKPAEAAPEETEAGSPATMQAAKPAKKTTDAETDKGKRTDEIPPRDPKSPPASTDEPPQPAKKPSASVPSKEWTPPNFTSRQTERAAMVRVIRAYGLKDKAVLQAMASVPRHEFVRKGEQSAAYDDTPLPIGYGQTISQPYIVAEMTRRLNLTRESRVLEIGTGSGYQAAVLTEFTRHVYSIEIVEPLAKTAKERLKRLGYDVVQVRTGDGYYGWPEEKSFDAIIVTCAAGQIPPPLIGQLAPGGRMVIPVGPAFGTQSLMLVQKDKDGTVRSRSLMLVRFVPLIRQNASSK